MINIYLISIGLAMDALAVAISSGITLKKTTYKTYLSFGLVFGFFQFIMPIIGYYGSKSFSSYFENYTKIISFLLLFFIGSKMFFESFSSEKADKNDNDILSISNMIILGIATSIDALAIGILIQINNQQILINSIIIGVVAFIFSSFGVFFGKKVGDLIGNKAEILGGVILIFLAFKFLI